MIGGSIRFAKVILRKASRHDATGCGNLSGRVMRANIAYQRAAKRALAALEVEEDGSTSRSTRQTENDPIITPCLHNDTPFGSYRREREGGREREREEAAERERYPKNQPNRPRWHPKTPGGNHHRRFHARRRSRGANCATIWFTSNERKTTPLAGSGTGRTERRRKGGGAAALTLCLL